MSFLSTKFFSSVLEADFLAKSKRPHSKRRTLLNIESLEERVVLTSGPAVYDADPILFDANHERIIVHGSDAADLAIISIDARTSSPLDDQVVVSLNRAGRQHTERFALNSVRELVFNGYGGNDFFQTFTYLQSVVDGGDGHDTLHGGTGNDWIDGWTGNDEIHGGDGDDTLHGGTGNDWMDGWHGHDWMRGWEGNDTMHGGTGNDWMDGWHDHDWMRGWEGNDTMHGGTGNDWMDGWHDHDWMRGWEGNDTMHGGTGNDWMDGWHDHDWMRGWEGNDTMHGGSGNDWMDGWHGHDDIRGWDGNETMYGGSGDDFISGGDDNDTIEGGTGNDRLYGDDGDDRLLGGDGYDRLQGNRGHDFLSGGDHDDTIYGSYGNDSLFGDDGHDRLYGEDGNDRVQGNRGNDTLIGGNHDDVIYGSYGDDRLYGDDGNDTLFGQDGNDRVQGGRGDDLLYGGRDDDTIYGSYGDDSLSGDSGDDWLYGQSGKDALLGGSGQDYLDGGAHADRYLTTPDRENPSYADSFVTDSWDVKVHFRNGQEDDLRLNGQDVTAQAGAWTIDEIWRVDAAFSVMVNRTGDNVLLERADGKEITIHRQGDIVDPAGNVTSFGGWNSNNGHIYLAEARFSNDISLRRVVYHEIAHNWDNESPLWNSFLELSGWAQNGMRWTPPAGSDWVQGNFNGGTSSWWYRDNTADGFARSYGQLNPMEDFATNFAYYFLTSEGETWPATVIGNITAKQDFIDSLVDRI